MCERHWETKWNKACMILSDVSGIKQTLNRCYWLLSWGFLSSILCRVRHCHYQSPGLINSVLNIVLPLPFKDTQSTASPTSHLPRMPLGLSLRKVSIFILCFPTIFSSNRTHVSSHYQKWCSPAQSPGVLVLLRAIAFYWMYKFVAMENILWLMRPWDQGYLEQAWTS